MVPHAPLRSAQWPARHLVPRGCSRRYAATQGTGTYAATGTYADRLVATQKHVATSLAPLKEGDGKAIVSVTDMRKALQLSWQHPLVLPRNINELLHGQLKGLLEAVSPDFNNASEKDLLAAASMFAHVAQGDGEALLAGALNRLKKGSSWAHLPAAEVVNILDHAKPRGGSDKAIVAFAKDILNDAGRHMGKYSLSQLPVLVQTQRSLLLKGHDVEGAARKALRDGPYTTGKDVVGALRAAVMLGEVGSLPEKFRDALTDKKFQVENAAAVLEFASDKSSPAHAALVRTLARQHIFPASGVSQLTSKGLAQIIRGTDTLQKTKAWEQDARDMLERLWPSTSSLLATNQLRGGDLADVVVTYMRQLALYQPLCRGAAARDGMGFLQQALNQTTAPRVVISEPGGSLLTGLENGLLGLSLQDIGRVAEALDPVENEVLLAAEQARVQAALELAFPASAAGDGAALLARELRLMPRLGPKIATIAALQRAAGDGVHPAAVGAIQAKTPEDLGRQVMGLSPGELAELCAVHAVWERDTVVVSAVFEAVRKISETLGGRIEKGGEDRSRSVTYSTSNVSSIIQALRQVKNTDMPRLVEELQVRLLAAVRAGKRPYTVGDAVKLLQGCGTEPQDMDVVEQVVRHALPILEEGTARQYTAFVDGISERISSIKVAGETTPSGTWAPYSPFGIMSTAIGDALPAYQQQLSFEDVVGIWKAMALISDHLPHHRTDTTAHLLQALGTVNIQNLLTADSVSVLAESFVKLRVYHAPILKRLSTWMTSWLRMRQSMAGRDGVIMTDEEAEVLHAFADKLSLLGYMASDISDVCASGLECDTLSLPSKVKLMHVLATFGHFPRQFLVASRAMARQAAELQQMDHDHQRMLFQMHLCGALQGPPQLKAELEREELREVLHESEATYSWYAQEVADRSSFLASEKHHQLKRALQDCGPPYSEMRTPEFKDTVYHVPFATARGDGQSDGVALLVVAKSEQLQWYCPVVPTGGDPLATWQTGKPLHEANWCEPSDDRPAGLFVFGPARAKALHLQALGYRVVPVFLSEWEHYHTPEERARYLKQKLDTEAFVSAVASTEKYDL